MKYYLIAGEASGDLHASNLMKALKKKDSQADFRFWGGDLMAAAGGHMVKHYRDLAFMGFWEVLTHLGTILRNIKTCKQDITDYAPDAIIFIDYPGFNFRIAKWAKAKGFPTHYYISPQLWAWKENRIKKIKRDVDELYVILPFEKDFYEEKHGFPVTFVGHPLLDVIKSRKRIDFVDFVKQHHLKEKPIIALLPGSRHQEINKMLSTMLAMPQHFPDYQFVIAGAPSQDPGFYRPFLKENKVELVMAATYDLLSVAHAALVTSGTATLETALFEVPEVVCYKGSYVSYLIARMVVGRHLKFISLVNLIMDRQVVTELIQSDFNTVRLQSELQAILSKQRRAGLAKDYTALKEKLGGSGASAKTAEQIVQKITARKK